MDCDWRLVTPRKGVIGGPLRLGGPLPALIVNTYRDGGGRSSSQVGRMPRRSLQSSMYEILRLVTPRMGVVGGPPRLGGLPPAVVDDTPGMGEAGHLPRSAGYLAKAAIMQLLFTLGVQ